MCFISHDIIHYVTLCFATIYIYITYYSLDNPQREKKHLTCCTLLKRSYSRSLHVCCMSYNKSCKLVSCTNKIFCIGVSCSMWRLTVSLKTPPPTTNQLDCMCSCKADLRSPQNSTVNPHTSHRMAFHQGGHHHPQSLGKSFGYYVTTHRRLKIKGNMDLRESEACEIRQDL